MAKGTRGGKRGSALGKQGSPMSPDKAYGMANPNYSSGKDYQNNCQRCVWAYELRRRGYDVEAKPTFDGDTLPSNGNWLGIIGKDRSAYDYDSWVYYNGTGAKVNKTAPQQNKAINERMHAWGDGSRAIISVGWKGSKTGHVFNVENVGGNIRAFDAQTGKEINIREYLNRAKPKNTFIFRTDNTTIDVSKASQYVKVKGDK